MFCHNAQEKNLSGEPGICYSEAFRFTVLLNANSAIVFYIIILFCFDSLHQPFFFSFVFFVNSSVSLIFCFSFFFLLLRLRSSRERAMVSNGFPPVTVLFFATMTKTTFEHPCRWDAGGRLMKCSFQENQVRLDVLGLFGGHHYEHLL